MASHAPTLPPSAIDLLTLKLIGRSLEQELRDVVGEPLPTELAGMAELLVESLPARKSSSADES